MSTYDLLIAPPYLSAEKRFLTLRRTAIMAIHILALGDSGTTRLTIALSGGWSRAQELMLVCTHDECNTDASWQMPGGYRSILSGRLTHGFNKYVR